MTREQFTAQQVALWSGRYAIRHGTTPTVPEIEGARKEYDDEYTQQQWMSKHYPDEPTYGVAITADGVAPCKLQGNTITITPPVQPTNVLL